MDAHNLRTSPKNATLNGFKLNNQHQNVFGTVKPPKNNTHLPPNIARVKDQMQTPPTSAGSTRRSSDVSPLVSGEVGLSRGHKRSRLGSFNGGPTAAQNIHSGSNSRGPSPGNAPPLKSFGLTIQTDQNLLYGPTAPGFRDFQNTHNQTDARRSPKMVYCPQIGFYAKQTLPVEPQFELPQELPPQYANLYENLHVFCGGSPKSNSPHQGYETPMAPHQVYEVSPSHQVYEGIIPHHGFEGSPRSAQDMKPHFSQHNQSQTHNQHNHSQVHSHESQNITPVKTSSPAIHPQFIEQYAPGIFMQFDSDKDGALDMMEVPVMINHLFNYLKMSPPTEDDVNELMQNFDSDQDGRLSLQEFKNLLYFLSGKK